MSDGGDQPQTQRPWASPRQQPIKGIVQPRVLPPFGKPTRHTNKLDYIMTTVLKEAAKHKHVWPFQKPVDAVTLCIPLYHERVLRPMDLKTIESRLKSTYYTCAQECIDDIETVFNNCYTFNGKEDDVTIMAQNVHEVIKKSLEQAPREEHDMDVYWGKNKKKTGKDGVKAGAASVKREARGPSEQPSEAGSEISSVLAGKPERKVAGKKTGKRKAESDEEEKQESHRAKRDVPVVKKEVHQPLHPSLKPCSKLLSEFFSKKYNEFTWPFHDPVNAAELGLHDYHKIIKEPMDMKTIKRKLECGEYKEPADFERDIRLMLNNCFIYNPIGDPVHNFGKKFEEVFDKRWAEMGDANSRASSVAPQSAPAPLPPSTPKIPKTATKGSKKEKEIKTEPATTFFESGGAKSEDIMQINNALSMLRERQARLRAELAATVSMEEKVTSIKSRREGHPNEPFPDKLITEVRIMCTTPISPGASTSTASGSANNTTNKNGRVKKPNPTGRQHGYDFDSDDEENKPALTYDEKRNLSHMVNRLPAPQLSTIISIIQRRECSALTQQSIDDSEIELDFESLGDMCLREMAAFMKTIEMKPAKDEDENPKPFRPAAPTISEKAPSAAPSTSSKPEKKKKSEKSSEKNFNMSESSDDETSTGRKRRKKDSSESESSSSSDDDSDDEGPSIPRKSGQPPSSEWKQSAPPPRMGGMGGQPPMARVPPPPPNTGKNGQGGSSSSYQATTKTPAAPSSIPAQKPKTATSIGVTPKNSDKGMRKEKGVSILDSLLPDTFGSSQPGPSASVNVTSSTDNGLNGGGHAENGENEAARIHRLRMEAKRARQREDENSLSMTNQMEMMSAFEYDNTY
ncbi:hypothetical protein GCK72_001279 [Caenorhabditis remanei]|uniref:Uncharacterized protein n=1 Tax=Caenorhabditis remanei TaxID=31234 RepID=A0A6A5HUN2_CAERE|nr:hypothetical protein GCK72_001279 [Caenorhabditis remanei]KAF1769462.1 hypothetical protein GCK72_001279 [Caenorhabditis remanei]